MLELGVGVKELDVWDDPTAGSPRGSVCEAFGIGNLIIKRPGRMAVRPYERIV